MTSSDVNIIFEEEPVEIMLNEDPVEIEMPAGQNGQSLRPRGAWSSSEGYGYLDLVSYQGSSYVATKTVPTGTLPTDTGFWMLSAEKGLDGASEWGDITGDIANQTDLAQALASKVDASDVYSKAQVDALLADKADADDVYTKDDVDDALALKADTDDVYTKTETDTLLQNKAPVILNSASGSIASLTDGSTLPVTALTVGIEPVQDGTGDPSPDNIRPISGWTGTRIFKTRKNLLNPANFNATRVTVDENGVYTFTAAGYNADLYTGQNGSHIIPSSYFDKLPYLPAGTYTWSFKYISGGAVRGVSKVDKNGNRASLSSSYAIKGDYYEVYFTLTEPSMINIERLSNETPGVFSEPQLELGTQRTAYEPFIGDVLPISWETEAGTVYGGNLNILTGMLTVTQKGVTLDNTADWIEFDTGKYRVDNVTTDDLLHKSGVQGYLSNLYLFAGTGNTQSTNVTTDKRFYIAYYYHRVLVYDSTYATLDAFKAMLAVTPLQIVYPLATPITVPLTPSQLSTLLGENNIWADTGDIEVTYRADTKLFIQEQIADSETLTRKMIADSATADGKAPKSIATGDLIIVGDELRKATANIGNGSAITASNSTTATLADVIKALQ